MKAFRDLLFRPSTPPKDTPEDEEEDGAEDGASETDADGVVTKTDPCLKHARVIDATKAPPDKGFLTISPTKLREAKLQARSGGQGAEVPRVKDSLLDEEGDRKRREMMTPKKTFPVPNYEVSEDSKVMGVLWPYNESILRRPRPRVPWERLDYEDLDVLDLHGFRDFSDDDEESPEKKAPDDGGALKHKRRKEWWKHVKPEAYNKALTVYCTHLEKKEEKKEAETDSAKEGRSSNEAESAEDAGIISYAVSKGKAALSFLK